MFDNIKNAMTFAKGERVAIIVLAAVILLIIAANFFVINHKPYVNKSLHNLDSIMVLHEKAIDDMMARELAEQMELKARNNKIKEERTKEKQQRLSKPTFNKAEKKETFKERGYDFGNSGTIVVKKDIPVVNINEADTLTLMELPEIGPFFARNIIDYRDKLGGYINKEQLLEVYGFDSIRLEIIIPYINIGDAELRKININSDEFKVILRHPYIEYEDVKKIVNYRDSRGFIKDWEMYKRIVGREDVNENLQWYLEF